MDTQPPIARIAAARGLSGRQLAQRMGVTFSTAQRIVRGDRPLKLEEAVVAARVLNCDVTDLATTPATPAEVPA